MRLVPSSVAVNVVALWAASPLPLVIDTPRPEDSEATCQLTAL